jgi:hypothetical protein
VLPLATRLQPPFSKLRDDGLQLVGGLLLLSGYFVPLAVTFRISENPRTGRSES